MREEELLDQIKKSAENIEIPDSVTPEQIARKLRRANTPKTYHFSAKKASSAAAVLLLCFALSGVAFYTEQTVPPLSTDSSVSAETAEKTEKTTQHADEPKRNAGKLYTVAKSYDEVYDMLEDSYSAYFNSYDTGSEGSMLADGADDIARTEDIAEYKISATNDLTNAASKMEETTDDYSKTNLQTEGVDESDLIKTDGRYIYTVKNQKILITDTSKEGLAPAGSVSPEMDPADSVLELYVDNGTLFLLTQHYESSITEAEDTDVSTYYNDEIDIYETDGGFIPLEDTAKMNAIMTNSSVTLYIYDVSDPANPELAGNASQDGFYKTSRKIGDMIYLFTTKSELANASFQKGRHDGILPCINGKEIPYDHIYLSSRGTDGLVVSSIDTRHPDEVVDQVMIVHDYVDIYVGNDSLYLYHTDYKNDDMLTEIAKFHIENGNINAVDAVSVKGEIYDPFAIQEYKNTLRVLTTSANRGITENHLFLFDENLALTGSLNGIAKGEEIYAARYFGDTAYFITYRNTDPLFAVDLSDTSNPVLLGQLEITGFSEYLHFWGGDKLLGIGYETDPDSGMTKGLKLVMFDISNPVDLKIIDTLVLKEYYYSPALYQYKCALADPEKNLIGFAAEQDPVDGGYVMNYNVYAWEDGHFTEKLRSKLPEYVSSEEIRGLYIKDKFYVAGMTEISEFDMNDGFQEKSRLSLGE